MKQHITKKLLPALAIPFLMGTLAYSQCTAGYTASETAGTVTFTNTSTGFAPMGPVFGFWTFGDGSTASTTGMAGTSHTYSTNGVYSVCLTMTDTSFFGGCSATWCDSIIVTGASGGGGSSCSADFTHAAVGCDVTFADMSSASAGIGAWYWSFGDGTSSTLTNPVHTYGSSGPWYVCLTIVGLDSCSNTYCSWVSAPGCGGSTFPCSASYTWVHDSTMAYTILLYNTSTGGPAMSYYWTFGDGSSSTLAYPSHVYAGAGSYEVCVTVTDSACTSTYCDTLDVLWKNAAAFSINVVSPATSIPQPVISQVTRTYPNPFSGELNVEMALTAAGEVRMELVDIAGRTIFASTQSNVAAGNQIVKINPGILQSGVYILRISTGGKTYYQKVLAN